ncbi:MAG: dual specificity protein phosphatase family protein [Pseudomonadota bacterium]
MEQNNYSSKTGIINDLQTRPYFHCFSFKIKLTITIALCLILVNFAFANESALKRPETWAQPLVIEGVPNLHKVSDNLYRSAQPTANGMKNLKEMGIKTVVNLRTFHSDRSKIGNTELKYEHIYMKAWHPEQEDIIRFLQIATDPNYTPVLVHCLHGADRTGTMSALYRIAIQGWPKDEAISEMTKGGFNFHTVFGNLPEWIQKLDIESIKKEAGIKNSAKH